MAKAGFYLQGAKGKLGDGVLQKGQNGTIIRVNTTPKNPKTTGQATQRALFAPVAKFYSPLSMCLEKSFEGKSKQESYQTFLRKNLNLAKQRGYLAPKGSGIVPFPYVISSGTIQPLLYEFGSDSIVLSNTTAADLGHELDGISTIGDLSKIFKELGYEEGDQVTFIFIKSNDSEDFSNCWVEYSRFEIAEASTIDFEPKGAQIVTDNEDGVSFLTKGAHIIAGGIVISRFENGEWRRSTQSMVCSELVMNTISQASYQVSARASYQPNTSGVGSDVYLDGGDGGVINNEVALSDGTLATLIGFHEVTEVTDVSYVNATQRGRSVKLLVKIGTDWLLTSTTKGTLPQGVTPPEVYLDGGVDDVQAWLQTQGVAASLF